jgi:prophage regulatory protein
MSINLITRAEAQEISGVFAESTWFKSVKAKLQVSGIKLSSNSVRYLKSDVESVRAARIAGFTDDQVRALVLKLEKQRCEEANELLADLNLIH